MDYIGYGVFLYFGILKDSGKLDLAMIGTNQVGFHIPFVVVFNAILRKIQFKKKKNQPVPAHPGESMVENELVFSKETLTDTLGFEWITTSSMDTEIL